MTDIKPVVTIRCLVYNHAPYLRDCLDGLVNQKVNFRYEAIIQDDASTDGSADIIREYAEKYPDIIVPIFHEENLYSKQDGSFSRLMNARTRGKYVAYCEGDDYWDDPLKLQTQVNFLESHPDYSAIFGTARVVDASGKNVLGFYPSDLKSTTLELPDLLKRNWVQNCTAMYRWRFYTSPGYDEIMLPGIVPGDWMIVLAHAQVGKVYYDARVWGVYRRHNGSMWEGVGATDDFYRRNGFGHLLFYEQAQKLFGPCFESECQEMMKDVAFACINLGDFALLKRVQERFPLLYKNFADHYSKKNRLEKPRLLANKLAVLVKKSKFAYAFLRLIYNLFHPLYKL